MTGAMLYYTVLLAVWMGLQFYWDRRGKRRHAKQLKELEAVVADFERVCEKYRASPLQEIPDGKRKPPEVTH